MTSISPAEPRPPLLRRSTDSNRPPHGRASSHIFSPLDRKPPTLRRETVETEEDRPIKRRKIEADSNSNQVANHHNTSLPDKVSDPHVDNKTVYWRWVRPSAIRAAVANSRSKEEEDTSSEDGLPELPPRPWRTARVAKVADKAAPTHRSRVDIPVPNTPDSIQVPSSAPQFVLKRPVGFFPWTGKHPEDILSDSNVKNGYFDKPPNPTEKELNTARVPLYNAFKHKSGVDSLSTLFSLVLNQKSQHGIISSVSTFKPPPRVTLTEAKRKSWIADLANADVPLRRLSRTIPQGIKGQTLLDLCLQSSVPLSRAIWFAKCVCANEVRTLKRKGTTPAVALGAENKWLREWTLNVEQFLETYLGQANASDWRSNIQYALRLNTRLYLENLLDRGHYLDWILHSFTTAAISHTPFWLMVIHIYKQDLSQYRRRGAKLAQALIDKYRSIDNLSDQSISPLRQKLRAAVRELLFSRPAIFLMPDRWPESVPIVQTCLDTTIGPEGLILEELNRINERAMGFNKTDFLSVRSPSEIIVETLDKARVPYNVALLAKELDETSTDFDLLLRSCLEWSCTRFRQSRTRLYLVTRLVKRWQRGGRDIDTPILNFLSAFREGKTTADTLCLRHLVAQFSRSDCFPLSKYLQWLMVRGLPEKGSVCIDTESIFGRTAKVESYRDFASVQFLLDLSLHRAEDHVINLRNSVLERAGFDPSAEEDIFERCVEYLEQKLADASFVTKSEPPTLHEPSFAALPWTLRTRISMWLRARALEAAKSAQSTPMLPGSKVLNEEQFFVIRHILECMEDEAVLADVVGILSVSQRDDLVASLVATVHFHAGSFSAIGALEVLQKRMCQIYMTWRSTKPTMPLLTSTLLDLCTAFPVKAPAIRLLQQDLVRGDRGRAVAACSPYSDGIAESLQQAGATFVEDFEAILQSETNMNEQTMNGLFSVLVDRIEKQQKFEDDPRTLQSFCQLLSRLRLCRKAQGDLLTQKWMSRLMSCLDSKSGPSFLRILVATGCITFATIFEATPGYKSGVRKNLAVASFLYQILAPPSSTSLDWAAYQTRTRWHEYSLKEPLTALEIVCEAGLQGVSPTFDSLLLVVLVNSWSPDSSSLAEPAKKWFVKSLSYALNCSDGDLNATDLQALLESINVFSHRFVQLRFRLASPASVDKASGLDQPDLIEVLSQSLKQTLRNPPSPYAGHRQRFSQLFQIVGPDVANQVRHNVENEFLYALPKLLVGRVTSPLSAVFPDDTQQLSSIVEQAFQVCRKETSPSPGFLSHLIDRLSQHLKYLGNTHNTPATPAAPATTAPTAPTGFSGPSGSSTTMTHSQMVSMSSSPVANTSDIGGGSCPPVGLSYLRCILQMVCLQRPTLISPGSNGANVKQTQNEQLQLLVRLASIATHPAMTLVTGHQGTREEQIKAKEVIEFALDVIATIIDGVSDEVHLMCAKVLKDKLQDTRLCYLFGSINLMGSAQVQDMGRGLQMVKEGKGIIGEWKPRMWEVLDSGSGKESETSLGLGLFRARYG
ncbi:hypothetical protein Z517_04226 [Fonsecaea pedrosoi CBS 271.37]|uniref:Mediator of RNA polymerase II transcription subunit 12 n=1 Tax=Fonsecaea pedrosoi CBS 271.37 TaxID=1442368 RepID=A0A0D2DTR6_9EURO|nr:uncharacterized protein Z517_04226 [Fonsecaea pedrosoi CBS 271.37]KIW81201.1 hypothetical protein Z517_04226 [Fonsecaea pedrosoi CBS 271.37]